MPKKSSFMDIVEAENSTSAYEQLSPTDKQIVLMRVDGMTYRQISEVLQAKGVQFAEITIRNYFIEGGRLKPAYDEKIKEKEERIAEFHKTATDLLIDVAYIALQNVKDAVTNSKNINVSLDVLDRVGLQKVLKVEVNENPLMDMLRKNIEAYERNNKIPVQNERATNGTDPDAE